MSSNGRVPSIYEALAVLREQIGQSALKHDEAALRHEEEASFHRAAAQGAQKALDTLSKLETAFGFPIHSRAPQKTSAKSATAKSAKSKSRSSSKTKTAGKKKVPTKKKKTAATNGSVSSPVQALLEQQRGPKRAASKALAGQPAPSNLSPKETRIFRALVRSADRLISTADLVAETKLKTSNQVHSSIHSLRQKGYKIDAERLDKTGKKRSVGYRLTRMP